MQHCQILLQEGRRLEQHGAEHLQGLGQPGRRQRGARNHEGLQAAEVGGVAALLTLSIAEVKQNVGRMSVKIPADLWSELKREKLLDPAAPTPN